MRLNRGRTILVGVTVLLISTGPSAYGQGQLICSPSVEVETQSCGVGDKIQTYARVTNKCACDVSVSVKLPGGGSAEFTSVKQGGGTERQMIVPCNSKKGEIGKSTYEFSCPERRTEPKPRDLSKQLQSASTDAKDAAAKNQQDLSQLGKQHQQGVENYVAQNKAGAVNWCASHAKNCDAQCVSKNRGSQNYVSERLCKLVQDAGGCLRIENSG